MNLKEILKRIKKIKIEKYKNFDVHSSA